MKANLHMCCDVRAYSGLCNDLVVDVGHAHDLKDGVALLRQHAPHNVQRHIGAGMSDVCMIVHGRPARVPRQGLASRQRLFGLGQAVEKHRALPRPDVGQKPPLGGGGVNNVS